MIVIKFEDSPTGKLAWHVWNKMTAEQKQATGYFRPHNELMNSTIIVMPGMTVEYYGHRWWPRKGGKRWRLKNKVRRFYVDKTARLNCQ